MEWCDAQVSAGGVMLGLAAGAQAADMPDFLRGGFTEGPPAATVYWQGYYIGGQEATDQSRQSRGLAATAACHRRSSRQPGNRQDS
jgi:hypothetical protein